MKYVVVFLFKPDMNWVLMQLKNRGPYPGKYNGVGGKVKPGELGIEAAYREIQEETGLTQADLEELVEMLVIKAPGGDILRVYYAVLKPNAKPQQVEDERLTLFPVNRLTDATSDYLAGDGDIPYYIQLARTLEAKRNGSLCGKYEGKPEHDIRGWEPK